MKKTNWESDQSNLDRMGLSYDTVPIDMFDWLKIKSFEAKNKENDATKALVGHINQEYYIKGVEDKYNILDVDNDETYLKLEQWVSRKCFTPPLNMFHGDNYVLSDNRPFSISSLWVNFQKKYEFNPPHIHGGVYSFIIFVNIPYELEDELKQFKTKTNATSKLHFTTPCPLHWNRCGIVRTDINVDKSFEGKIIIFPAHLQHGVFPFYTSDDYRITISGNVVFKV